MIQHDCYYREDNEMKITHIYHSAFLVILEEGALLFDWYKGNLPDIPKDKKLYVFCSHSHEDHYSPQIWDLQKSHPDVTYILDEGIADAAQHPKAQVVKVKARESYRVPAGGEGPAVLKITTLESTDMGVAFYIETEGKRIYHAGDLNVWFWNDEPMEDNIASEKKCRAEMQFLADCIRKEHPELTAADKKPEPQLLDVAFVPLDFRLEEHAPRCIASFMEILGAGDVFPMHYWGRREQVKEYLKDPRIARYADRICFENEADL